LPEESELLIYLNLHPAIEYQAHNLQISSYLNKFAIYIKFTI